MSTYKCRLVAAALFCLSLAHQPEAKAATPAWQPARTWVFAASLLQFKEKEMFDSFPTKNRRDDKIIQLFARRGVPASHIAYLKDKQATLRAITSSFEAMLRKTRPGDTLFFYYQGHGFRSEDKSKPDAFFATYDTDGDAVEGWSENSITRTINRLFKGSRAILTADCCYSGYLAQTVKRIQGAISYACLSSSSAREASTGHWTFSDCLLDAFNGAPYVDLNADGVVTVSEWARFAHNEMAVAEEQHAAFSLSGAFNREMVIASSGPQPKSPIGQRVKARQDGYWYAARVVAVKGNQLQVDYIGYDEADEWFDSRDQSQLKWIDTKPKFAVGALVEVAWRGDWYKARVLKVDNGVYFIHYIEDDSSWDEWVSSKRIRAR